MWKEKGLSEEREMLGSPRGGSKQKGGAKLPSPSKKQKGGEGCVLTPRGGMEAVATPQQGEVRKPPSTNYGL